MLVNVIEFQAALPVLSEACVTAVRLPVDGSVAEPVSYISITPVWLSVLGAALKMVRAFALSPLKDAGASFVGAALLLHAFGSHPLAAEVPVAHAWRS
jgi:hypothetical protein